MQMPQGWSIRHREVREPRAATLVDPQTVPLGEAARTVARELFPRGLFTHQADAVRAVASGADVCLATGTSSGKSLAFALAAINILEQDPTALIVAIYPLKALANDQVGRWNTTLATAGIGKGAVRIVGDVERPLRLGLMASASVVCVTPDIIHAWWLARLEEPELREQMRRVRLVIADEVHAYTGVLGSNSAYLFRRFDHVCQLLGSKIQYFAASATLQEGDPRLSRLFGRPFTLIGPDRDGSHRHRVETILVEPPEGTEALQAATGMLEHLHSVMGSRVLLFADSRKQVEHITEIIGRGTDQEHLPISERWFLPYRAGYEEADRRAIESRLSDESLRLIISTSALELGLDIPNLDSVVVLGVPQSSMSLQQRVGRVGRHRDGTVFIINSGSATDKALFSDPSLVLKRPYPDAALYLDNRNVQYIHAMCLARRGGEHDLASGISAAQESPGISTEVEFPAGFLELCEAERTGQIPRDLEDLSAAATDRPQWQFPVRSNERQYQIRLGFTGDARSLGQLTQSQLLREAYPGALYRHQGASYRVLSVKQDTQTVAVKRENGAPTSPANMPSQLFPNFADSARTRVVRWGQLTVIEAPLQVIDSVIGVQISAPQRRTVNYPLVGLELGGVRFPNRFFSRRFWTTGVLLSFPGLEELPRQSELADVLLDAFLLTYPIERQDVSAGAGSLALGVADLQPKSRYLSIYDQAYGSLRITSRLLDQDILRRTLQLAAVIGQAADGERAALEPRVLETLLLMADQLAQAPNEIRRPVGTPAVADSVDAPLAPMPGTAVWSVLSAGRRLVVSRVYFSPTNGLMVSGRFDDEAEGAQTHSLPLRNVEFIPGETLVGSYDAEVGDFVGTPATFGGLA